MSDTPKTDNGIREVLESVAEIAAIYGDNQHRTDAHISTAEKFIKAIRRADMEAVIGNGCTHRGNKLCDVQNRLRREQRKRMEERLNENL